jgi:hypothetical protein
MPVILTLNNSPAASFHITNYSDRNLCLQQTMKSAYRVLLYSSPFKSSVATANLAALPVNGVFYYDILFDIICTKLQWEKRKGAGWGVLGLPGEDVDEK